MMKLRFSLRDLLWLFALLAVCGGWWLDHHSLEKYVKLWASLDDQHIMEQQHKRIKELESIVDSLKPPELPATIASPDK